VEFGAKFSEPIQLKQATREVSPSGSICIDYMVVEVETIQSYRVEREGGAQRIFLQVNNQEKWQLLKECKIAP